MSVSKPSKPYPEFPLYAHARGRWAKKMNGTVRYFGSWRQTRPSDPDGSKGALAEYEAEVSKSVTVVMTVANGLNLFLDSKLSGAKSGEITHRTYVEHQRTCTRFADTIGRERDITSLTPDDFALFRRERQKTLNLVSLGNEITRVRTAFKWLHENRKIHTEMHFGSDFKRPGRRALRKHRRLQGRKLFTAEQIRLLLDEAGIHLRAMILLGINCAYGPHDCAVLPLSVVDIDEGWIDWVREKTEVERLCPLWPETVDALQVSLDRRPSPNDIASSRFFVQYSGKPYSNDDGDLSRYFTAVRRRLLQVPDGGFYWLRHTFETIGGDAKDQIAVNAIMGHIDDTMAAVYREGIDPNRLRSVTNHVRSWLYDE